MVRCLYIKGVKRTLECVIASAVLMIASLIVLGCGPPGTAPREGAETPSAPGEGTPLAYEAELCVNEARINVLVADTPQERAVGLSGYPGLPEDAGMLFVFPEPRQPSFWMKGMEFALDLIWIRDGICGADTMSRSRPRRRIHLTTNSRATSRPHRSHTCWN